MLRQWSRKTVLTTSDLDAIRALFGEKVLFQLSLGSAILGYCELTLYRSLSTTLLFIAIRYSSWCPQDWAFLDGYI